MYVNREPGHSRPLSSEDIRESRGGRPPRQAFTRGRGSNPLGGYIKRGDGQRSSEIGTAL